MKAGSGKEGVFRRLQSEGFSKEMCEGYYVTLRAFLSARSTKIEFEMAMKELLPADKIPAHNALIRDLLRRALAKRDGAPEVPVLIPIKDKKGIPSKRADFAKGGVTSPSGVAKKAQGPGEKRKPRDEDGKTKTKAAQRRLEKENALTAAAAGEAEVPKEAGPGLPRKTKEKSSVAKQSAPVRAAQQKETSTSYERMAFLPVRPGETVDIDMYLTLRQRMRRLAEDEGVPLVKDDTALLMSLALEIRIKHLISETVTAAGHQNQYFSRPKNPRSIEVLDMLLAADRFTGDFGFALERLSLAVF